MFNVDRLSRQTTPSKDQGRKAARWLMVLVTLGSTSMPLLAAAPAPAAISVSYSAKARAELRASKERVIVWAAYYGEANAAGQSHRDEVGQIPLGYERVELSPDPATVKLSGKQINTRKLRWIKGPIQANINVYSARRTHKDNLLACDFFEGSLAVLRRRSTTLRCQLITEGVGTVHKS